MGLFDGLFGESDADYQAKIQGQQAAAAAKALQDNANQNSASGQGYVNTAGNQYGAIYGAGQKEASSSWDNLQNYMQQFAKLSGINYAAPGANPYGNAGGVPTAQSTNKYGTGYVPTLAGATPGNNAPNGRVPTGYTPGGTTQPATWGGQVATGYTPPAVAGATSTTTGQTGPNSTTLASDSPFALDQPAQEALNQLIDKTNAERKTALDTYNSSTAQPLPEYQRQINQHYDELNNQNTTAAGQASQARREQAAQQMITQLTGLLSSGNSQQLSGTQGTAGLGTTQLGLAASELGGSANLTANAANIARQNQINQDNQLNQLLAYGITGGFGGLFGGSGGGGLQSDSGFAAALGV